jgi:hypothetical protein
MTRWWKTALAGILALAVCLGLLGWVNAREMAARELGKGATFTTGDGASPETQKFVRETGNAIVLKPFKIGELEQAIAAALAHGAAPPTTNS